MLLLLSACSRDQETPVKPTDACITRASAIHGWVIEGEYIITYRAETPSPGSSANARVAAQGLAADVLARPHINATSIRRSFAGHRLGFAGTFSPTKVAALQKDPRVLSIEPDRIVSIASCFTVVDPGRITWGTKWVGYGDGTGKTAWIIDTGIDADHPDLNVDKERSVSYVNGKTFDDDNGHGTHVAGSIGAKNNREGILGVASNARLVSLKVMNQVGEGRLSNVLAALGHVYRNGKPGDVVNMSLGYLPNAGL